jgi:hypothetical protein
MEQKNFWNQTLQGLIPNPHNHTITDELQCYSLPFGTLGFVGHLFTYWTVASLIIGRQPLRFWGNKSLHRRRWNLFLDFTCLFGSVGFAIWALVKCLGTWQYVLIATWKITLSISLSGMALHRTFDLHKDRQKAFLKKTASDSSLNTLVGNGSNANFPMGNGTNGRPQHAYQRVGGSEYAPNYLGADDNSSGYMSSGTSSPSKEKLKFQLNSASPLFDENEPIFKKRLFLWLILYLIGTFVGLIGLGSIVHRRWIEAPDESNVQLVKITCVFLGLAFGPVSFYLIFAVLAWNLGIKLSTGGTVLLILGHTGASLTILAGWVGIIAALYSDWALGAIMNNLTGVPSASNWVIYIMYFVAKRLPMFSL